MSRANESLTYDQHQVIESHVPTYLRVWVALLVFTVLEYFYALLVQHHFTALVLGLMAMALSKAALVGLYFMHLKFEGRWPYFMIVPACVLAAGLVIALIPDIGSQKTRLPRGPEDDFAARAATTRPAPMVG